MDNRKWEADAIVSPPTAPASPSNGYPTNGDPGAAQNATEPGAWWFHAIGEEIREVIVSAGLTPDHQDLTQLSDAILALITANIVTVPDASETVKGIGELATDLEAQSFTANKLIDGQKLESALKGGNQSLANSGYQKLPGGLIIQWGEAYTADGLSAVVTYPITFPNGVFSIVGADIATTSATTQAHGFEKISTSQFKTWNASSAGTAVFWVAFGY